MSALRILALDCATATGFATNAAGGIESGCVRFELRRGESAGCRWLNFRAWLNGLLEVFRPDLILFEDAFIGAMRSGTTAEIAYGMKTRVQEIAEARGVDYRPVHNATLKKWATGKGNAGKPEMMAAASARYGRPVTDDNEADALLLLAWGLDGMPETQGQGKKRRAVGEARRVGEGAG